MAEKIHKVERQGGITIHREIPAARRAEEFDTSKVSEVTRSAFKDVCADENMKHVLASIMGSAVLEDILK